MRMSLCSRMDQSELPKVCFYLLRYITFRPIIVFFVHHLQSLFYYSSVKKKLLYKLLVRRLFWDGYPSSASHCARDSLSWRLGYAGHGWG
jgi:hypothetical protein